MHGWRILRGCLLAWVAASVFVWALAGAWTLDQLWRTLVFGLYPAVPAASLAFAGGLVTAMCGAVAAIWIAPLCAFLAAALFLFATGIPFSGTCLIASAFAVFSVVAWIGAFGLRWRVPFDLRHRPQLGSVDRRRT